jgi:hypothetical protein
MVAIGAVLPQCMGRLDKYTLAVPRRSKQLKLARRSCSNRPIDNMSLTKPIHPLVVRQLCVLMINDSRGQGADHSS